MAKQRVKQLNSAGVTSGWVPTADGSGGTDWSAPSGGGSGVATKSDLTKAGIAVAQVVLGDGTKAQADSAANAEAVGVVESVNGSVGTVVTNGRITLASGVWPDSAAADDVLYIDETTAGLLTTTEPTTEGDVSKPIVICSSTTAGFVVSMRGVLVTTLSLSQAPLLHIKDEKSPTTYGGVFTLGAWRTRDLNTVKTNDIVGATLASNQITLPAGSYYIEGRAPAYIVERHTTRLQDITNAVTLIEGSSAIMQGAGVQTDSWVHGEFTLSAEADIELQHRCTVSAANGFGIYSSFTTSVYSEIRIWKIGN